MAGRRSRTPASVSARVKAGVKRARGAVSTT
jgi:hypothetical protein